MRQARNPALSLVRGVSMLMIILCHMMQYYGFSIAWWLNVGVQIFLVLSGFLHANKKVTDRLSFLGKRFSRILIDYWVFVIPVLVLYWAFSGGNLSPSAALDVLCFHGTIEGLGHLWFIPYILLCYILTPIMQDIFFQVEKLGGYVYWAAVILVFFGTHIVLSLFMSYFNPAWINTYMLGLVIGRGEKRKDLTAWQYGIPIALLTILFLGVQFLGRSASFIETGGLWGKAWQVWKNYGHTFLGAFLFVVLREIAGKMKKMTGGGYAWLEHCIDRYSYDVYLTHHIFILGPFSFMAISHVIPVNIMLIFALTLSSAVLLEKVSTIVREKWFVYCKKIIEFTRE